MAGGENGDVEYCKWRSIGEIDHDSADLSFVCLRKIIYPMLGLIESIW